MPKARIVGEWIARVCFALGWALFTLSLLSSAASANVGPPGSSGGLDCIYAGDELAYVNCLCEKEYGFGTPEYDACINAKKCKGDAECDKKCNVQIYGFCEERRVHCNGGNNGPFKCQDCKCCPVATLKKCSCINRHGFLASCKKQNPQVSGF